jgi:hypothetical protein
MNKIYNKYINFNTHSYTSYYGDDSQKCKLNTLTPQRVATITGYVTNPTNSYDDLMNSLVNEGPIAITVDASQWGSYAGGIFDGCNQENPDLDHAVLLVGYGTENGQDYWLVRNRYLLLLCTPFIVHLCCFITLSSFTHTNGINLTLLILFDIDRIIYLYVSIDMSRFIYIVGDLLGVSRATSAWLRPVTSLQDAAQTLAPLMEWDVKVDLPVLKCAVLVVSCMILPTQLVELSHKDKDSLKVPI